MELFSKYIILRIMIWIAIFIGTIMVADGLFALTHKDFVEEHINKQLPLNIDLQTFALGEFLIGLSVILSGTYAQIKLYY